MTVAVRAPVPVEQRPEHLGAARQLVLVIIEARPTVLLVFACRFAAGAGSLTHGLGEASTFAGWLLLVIAIYAFNGSTDVATDIANDSRRPIASGRLPARAARTWCLGAASAGLALCWLGGPDVFGLAVALLLVGWSYSAGPAWKNTRLGCGIAVGVGAALTYLAGWLANGGGDSRVLGLTPAVSVWIGLCCASKDFSDVDGDRAAGRRTLPVCLGARRAAWVLGAAAIAAAAAVFAVSLRGGVATWPAIVLVVGSGALAMSALRSAGDADRGRRRRPYRVFMATQFALNLALLIVTGR